MTSQDKAASLKSEIIASVAPAVRAALEEKFEVVNFEDDDTARDCWLTLTEEAEVDWFVHHFGEIFKERMPRRVASDFEEMCQSYEVTVSFNGEELTWNDTYGGRDYTFNFKTGWVRSW